VGVEPTAAGSAPPATDFEDRGIHRDTFPPAHIILYGAHYAKSWKTTHVRQNAAPTNRWRRALENRSYAWGNRIILHTTDDYNTIRAMNNSQQPARSAVERHSVTSKWQCLFPVQFGVVMMLAASLLLSACEPPEQLKPMIVGAEVLAINYFTIASVTISPTGSSGPVEGVESTIITTSAPTSAPTTAATTATRQLTVTAPVTASASLTVTAGATATGASAVQDIAATAPMTPNYSPQIPVTLIIPSLKLRAPVTPMGWELVLVDDKTATRWVVPTDSVGWAVNSAAAGEPGNMVIAGHQAVGQALFRPLALGEAEVGQEIDVLAADGKQYQYKIVEESAPITAIGATADEQARAAAYLEPGDTAKLTLITGWPADVSTHRVFIVADYVGEKP
jgi:hypothetical protein